MFTSESSTNILGTKCDTVKFTSNFIYNNSETFGYIKQYCISFIFASLILLRLFWNCFPK